MKSNYMLFLLVITVFKIDTSCDEFNNNNNNNNK